MKATISKGNLESSKDSNAALQFQMIDFARQNGGAQSFSAGLHVAILAVLVFAIASAQPTRGLRPSTSIGLGDKLLPYIPPIQTTGSTSLGSDGRGGERDSRPARFGKLAPGSLMALAPPRLLHNEQPILPAPPAVFDPNAPANAPVITDLGLPWMKSDTDSGGRGNGHGFGDSDGESMGDNNGNGAGDGDGHGPYANMVSSVTCVYCPQPGYTEEARKAKLQGKLLLQVLVGADGRARRVRILQGLGMGLDEQAAETVRGWRFSPARDARKHPVATWVTIETRFQLY
jgi:protein TonB